MQQLNTTNYDMSLDVLVSCTIITEDMPDKTFICGQEAAVVDVLIVEYGIKILKIHDKNQ